MADLSSIDNSVEKLRKEVLLCEKQLRELKKELAQAEALRSCTKGQTYNPYISVDTDAVDQAHYETVGASLQKDRTGRSNWKWPLEADEYKRYGRQLVLPEIGTKGQLLLKQSSVLIIGVGGLGCPAAAYLAGAGIGSLGLMDADTVELSNLHRQILHNSKTIGSHKVDSAVKYLKGLNPLVKTVALDHQLKPTNALHTLAAYDIVLDCTDQPTSRYLISDACVLLGKPLVSASALKTEGQLVVLNWPPAPTVSTTGTYVNGDPPRSSGTAQGSNPEATKTQDTKSQGPCYRCVFPRPPPAETVLSCGEGGILGPVVGAMGVLQALEAIKIITSGQLHLKSHEATVPSNVSDDVWISSEFKDGIADAYPASRAPIGPPSLLLFSAYSSTPFRTVRLRSPRPNCAACSPKATISKESLRSGSMDYVQFCGVVAPVIVLKPEERIFVKKLQVLMASETGYNSERPEAEQNGARGKKTILVDVRERPHFDLCSLPGSINVPYSSIVSTVSVRLDDDFNSDLSSHSIKIEGEDEKSSSAARHDLPAWLPRSLIEWESSQIVVICQRGNDSQLAVKAFKDLGLDEMHGMKRQIRDVDGGWLAWRRQVDDTWPEY